MKTKKKKRKLKNALRKVIDTFTELQCYCNLQTEWLQRQINIIESYLDTDEDISFEEYKGRFSNNPLTLSDYIDSFLYLDDTTNNYKNVKCGDKELTPQDLSYHYNFGKFRDSDADTADDTILSCPTSTEGNDGTESVADIHKGDSIIPNADTAYNTSGTGDNGIDSERYIDIQTFMEIIDFIKSREDDGK